MLFIVLTMIYGNPLYFYKVKFFKILGLDKVCNLINVLKKGS